MATRQDRDKRDETPFSRFQDFARRLLAVPKREIDEREQAAKQAKKSSVADQRDS